MTNTFVGARTRNLGRFERAAATTNDGASGRGADRPERLLLGKIQAPNRQRIDRGLDAEMPSAEDCRGCVSDRPRHPNLNKGAGHVFRFDGLDRATAVAGDDPRLAVVC
jgi:hypothetical protein